MLDFFLAGSDESAEMEIQGREDLPKMQVYLNVFD